MSYLKSIVKREEKRIYITGNMKGIRKKSNYEISQVTKCMAWNIQFILNNGI
jgi:hypothetical protein